MSIVNETNMNRSDLKDVMLNKIREIIFFFEEICEIILEEESVG
jgi:hypothetical protein